MNRPILVTGAAGFAGRHLVERLALDGPVVGCGRSPAGPPVANLTWYQLDLLDRERVRAAIHDIRPGLVYHCAGYPSVAESWVDRVQPLAVNVRATHHLLDALQRADLACRVLVTGSSSVYKPSLRPVAESDPLAPANPYAVSKLAQEQVALSANRQGALEVVLVRPFNHTGPRQEPAFFAPAMARQVAQIEAGLRPRVIHVGNLDAERDLSDVRDVVAAYVALAHAGEAGTIYNVASGRARSMRSVLDALIGLTGIDVAIETDPSRLRPADVPYQAGDASRLRHTTGWQPRIPFEATLRDLMGYWRDRVKTEGPTGLT